MHSGRLALVAGALFALLGQAAAGADAPAQYRALILDGHQLKWGRPRLGSEAIVSYAVVRKERQFSGARNCSRLGPMGAILAANHITAASFRAELAHAFRAWQSVAGITFVPGDPRSADILIGGQIKPRGRAFTNVSYDVAAKTPGIRSITHALICLNPTKPWKIGFDGDLDVYDLRYTLMHEIGHAIGLNHPEASGTLMHFRYHEKFRALQAGDRRGAIALYGRAAIPKMLAGKSAEPSSAENAKNWAEAAFDERRSSGRDAVGEQR